MDYHNNLVNIQFEIRASARVLMSAFMMLSQAKDKVTQQELQNRIAHISFRITTLKWVLESRN